MGPILPGASAEQGGPNEPGDASSTVWWGHERMPRPRLCPEWRVGAWREAGAGPLERAREREPDDDRDEEPEEEDQRDLRPAELGEHRGEGAHHSCPASARSAFALVAMPVGAADLSSGAGR